MNASVGGADTFMADAKPGSGSWELVMEPVAQVSQALAVIENVRKVSSTIWVNWNQCKRIADRFGVIGEALKGMELDVNKNSPDNNNNNNNKKVDYPAFDELLTVLRKGEALVSYYSGWKGVKGALSRTDNREAFQEIHQELDTLDSQFQFEDSDGKSFGTTSGVEKSVLLEEDAEKDLQEMPRKLEELARNTEDPFNPKPETQDLGLLKQVVEEKSKPVGEDGKLPVYLSIDLKSLETNAPVREYVRQSSRDPTEQDGWALVRNGKWLGCEFAIKVFESGHEWNNEQLMKEVGALVELRHPHVIRLVGFGQDAKRGVILMELMDGDLRNFMKQKLQSQPKSARPFTRSEELDIITQIAKGMYYLHAQRYVHGDLKCSNILVKTFGDSGGAHIEVKIADLRNAMKLDHWDQAAFDQAHSTRRPRWTPPEAIKHFNGVQPTADALLKADVYSFAMTCYEVVTGKYPFDGIKDEKLLEQIEAGVMPELPGELDDDLKGVIRSCWDREPANRPSFESICYVLDYIRSKKSAEGIHNSSGKDVVLGLFRRIPQVQGAFTGLLGRVRGKEQNVKAPESSSWDDAAQGSPFQRSTSSLSFAEHLRIKPHDLKKLRKIGSGASAKVYTATWLGCTFAVKRFKSHYDINALAQELEFLIALRHPYVAQLVGLSVGADHECMIVMEFVDSNLGELIKSRHRKRRHIHSSPEQQEADVLPFNIHEAVVIIRKIALGMAFLHSRGVMHRDLKPANVLMQEHPGHMDVKIVDFGLSRYVNESETHGSYVGVGTGFYRAPEILPGPLADRSSKPNLRAIDVYSFAMTCYEVVTGRVPCSELARTDYDPVITGYRPELPGNLHPDLKALIQKCWHSEPEQRPDFTYICEEILRIQQALPRSSSS